MKTRKILAVLSAAVMIFSAAETISFADDPEEETSFIEIVGDDNPNVRYTYAASVSANISLSGNTLVCQSKLTGSSQITRINADQFLEKKSGSSWKTLRSWSRTANNGRISLTNCVSASSGTYRTTTVFRVYSGKKYETIVKYSETKTFSVKKDDIDNGDKICMASDAEINKLLEAAGEWYDRDAGAAAFVDCGGFNSNIYRTFCTNYLFDYYKGKTDKLIPDDPDWVEYHVETKGKWYKCMQRKNSSLYGDNVFRSQGLLDLGYLTMKQCLNKAEEIKAQVDEEILEFEYFFSRDDNMTIIYFRTGSGEYAVPYHNKIWKAEYKGMAECGMIYPARELVDFLSLPYYDTVEAIDNKLQTVFVNPDGSEEIIDGDIDYDSMEFIDGKVILSGRNAARVTGDADGNGKLDVRDCAFIAKTLAGKSKAVLNDNADYNKDGSRDIRDAAAIAKYLADKKR